MKIEKIEPRDWGKVKATFNVVTEDGITIYNFKIINSGNELWISKPDHKGGDGKYYPNVWLPKETFDKLSEKAIKSYQELVGESPKEPDTPPI